MSTTIRVSEKTRNTVNALAEQTGKPATKLVAVAVEKFRRREFLRQTNKAFAVIRSDTDTWAQELEERKEWGIF